MEPNYNLTATATKSGPNGSVAALVIQSGTGPEKEKGHKLSVIYPFSATVLPQE